MRLKTTALLLIASMVQLAGCKDESPPAPSVQPSAAGAAEPTGETPAAPKPPAPDTAQPAPPKPAAKDAAAGDAATPPIPADPSPREAFLRTYFDHLAARRMDDAKKLSLLRLDECQQVFREKDACDKMVEAQKLAYENLATDPVPFNAKVLAVYEGQKQMLDAKRGAKVDTPLWVGSSISARGPDGHEFIMRSLAIMEAPAGLRILWGKRRAFRDTPRNRKPNPAAKAPKPTPPVKTESTQ